MLALLALSLLDPAPALELQASQPPLAAPVSQWSYDFATYYWAASIGGSLAINGQEVDVEDGGDGGFGAPALIGFLGHFEANHGPWSFVFAPIFINASDMQGGQPPNTDANLTIKAQVHELFVAHELGAGWEWMAGARYQRIETDMDLSVGGVPTGSFGSTRNWTDPIVGLRYNTPLGADWRLNARADIGGFGVGSDFAWNASAIATYKFSELFGAYLGYRALSFDWTDLGAGGRTAYNLSMYGPILGISFTF
jgi:hypothetical protein